MTAPRAPRRAGRYEVGEPFASGGMAVVHLGWDSVDECAVAVKRMHRHLSFDPTTRARFTLEGDIGACLRHPNLVAMVATVQHEGQAAHVLEYVDGPTVAELPPAPADVVAALMCDVASGLAAAHAACDAAGVPLGLVHCDVAPANVLVGPDGRARLFDFGVAQVHQRVLPLPLPRRGYSAPELRATGRGTVATDVYAFGATLVASLDDRTGSELLTLAGRCLADDPAARPRAMSEVVALLEAAPRATGTAVAGWVAAQGIEPLSLRRKRVTRQRMRRSRA